MTNPIIYTGTIGAELEVHTTADLVTDVRSVVLSVQTPMGVIKSWTPYSIDATSPASCIIKYRTAAGDLDDDDTYVIQPVVTMTNDDVWPLGCAFWKIYPRYVGV